MTGDLAGRSIVRLLRQESGRLERLRVGLDALDRDVRTLLSGRLHIWFCIDFHNLRQYLASRSLASLSTDDQRLVSEEYVCALLFHAQPKPLVLLPSYYDEFLSHVRNLASGGTRLAGERDLWLRSLRQRLSNELMGKNGLLAQIETQAANPNDLAVTVEELKSKVLKVLVDVDAKMNRARKAVIFLERFDHLFRAGKLVGLREVVEDPEKQGLKDDKVYWRARHFFDNLRSTEDKAKANENDARALSLVYQLNKSLTERGQVCVLISSAESMSACVATLNDELSPAGERIELRDLEYWLLWFNLVHESRSGDRVPSLNQIGNISRSLSGILGDLQEQCDRLLIGFKRSGQGQANDELLEDLKSYLQRLNDLLVEISRPILGGRWLSAELEREFVPVAGENEFLEAMNRLRELLEKLESPGFDVGVLRRELEEVLRGLEAILVAAEADAWKRFDRMLSLNVPFVAGLRWEIEEIEEPYASLLRLLEKGGRETAVVVAKRCIELRAEGKRGYEGHVVAAKAYLMQGMLEEAKGEVDLVEKGDQARPGVQLVKAVIQKEMNELDAAEAALKSLQGSYRDPLISLNLSSLFMKRFEQTGEIGCLESAIAYARGVLDDSTDNASVMSEAKILLIRLRFLRAGNDAEELRRLLVALQELRREFERADLAEPIRAALEGLEADIDAKLKAG